jgi:Leucine-rich repeat (LRR) protein
LEKKIITTASPVIQKISPGFELKINPLRARLKEIYGFTFPESFFLFWQFYTQLPQKSSAGGFGTALTVNLGEVFDIFKTETDIESFNPLNAFRHYNDPPEFFTLLRSQINGLHWGFYVDDPGQVKNEIPIAYYYANDDFILHLVGHNLFEVIRYELERAYADFNDNLDKADMAEAIEYYQKKLGQLELIRDLLFKYCTAERRETGWDYLNNYHLQRHFDIATRDGFGIQIPPNTYKSLPEKDHFTEPDYHPSAESVEKMAKKALDLLAQGYPANALKLGKDLWTFPLFHQTCHQLLEKAYLALQRPILAKMLDFRKEPEIDEMKEFKIGQKNIEQLKTLNLREKNLYQLSPKITQFKNLECLFLSFNNLENLPIELSQLQNLKELYLDINLFIDFPAVISQLKNLKVLSLKENYLSHLPETIQYLSYLEVLDLDKNKFQEFPKAVCHLDNLKILYFRGGSIHTIPNEIELLKNLRELAWKTDRKPKNISSNVRKLEKLQKLEFAYMETESQNSVENIAFPKEFCYIPHLKELKISTNKILQLPTEFENLQYLESLTLEAPQLSHLPKEIFALKSLKKLKVSNAKIGEIPSQISNLLALEDVYLYGNAITEIPKELSQLNKLQKINLQANPLTDKAKQTLKESLPQTVIQV